MKTALAHPFSLVSLVALAGALVAPFALFGLHFSPRALLGVVLLASAFFLIVLGHFYVARDWRRHLVLALANVPLMLAWWFAATAMAFLAPGLSGAAVLGAVLCIPVAVLLFVVRRSRREGGAV